MAVLVTLLTLVWYGLAGSLWWKYRTPIFVFTLLSGHGAIFLSPLWVLLYGVVYSPDFEVFYELFGHEWLRLPLIAGSWFYALPALLIFYLYRYHLQLRFSGYLTGIIIFGVFLFYHLILETVGLRWEAWSYDVGVVLPFGISSALLSVIMAALISLCLLYLLFMIHRYAWLSMLVTLLPATFILSLLIHGLLGAPVWIALLLPSQDWSILIGMLSTLALLGWGVHIVCWGLDRLDLEFR